MLKTTLHINFDRSRLVVSAQNDELGSVRMVSNQENAVERLKMIYDELRALNAVSSMGLPGERRALGGQVERVGRTVYELVFGGLEGVWDGTDEFIVIHDQFQFFIPSELAFDGKEFLCMRAKVGNVIIAPEQRRPLVEYQFSDPTAVLCGYDGEGVESVFASNRTLKWRRVFDSSSLRTATLEGRASILHFAGHGLSADGGHELVVRGRDRSDQPLLLNVDEFASRSNLTGAFIFLNACSSGKFADGPVQLDLAKEFLIAGADWCVLASLPLSDYSAELFAAEFYKHALAGRSVGSALLQARRSLLAQTDDLVTSLSYILFGRPDNSLFTTELVSTRTSSRP
jgi:hypothetical protein